MKFLWISPLMFKIKIKCTLVIESVRLENEEDSKWQDINGPC